ncbi:MAG: cytochrome c-type biogenesis protein CcmH, partial [Actinomycetota bacterium]|nr:cytochrome c-type biogenesis protein CcmH [Actinomycetota bacterium]
AAAVRTALAAVVLVTALLLAAPAPAAVPRASLTDIENDVMCVSCREPLALAQSPQALAERAYVRTLVAQGLTKTQIERALVVQYGVAVLGRPPAQGFNLTVYILPPALLLAGLCTLAVALPRWRRRAKATTADAAPDGPKLSEVEAQRLEQDLARFER